MRLLLNLFIICFGVGSLVFAYNFHQESIEAMHDLNKERYERMAAEEKLLDLDTKVNSLEIDLARAQAKAENAERMLEQVKNSGTDLKSKIDELSQANQSLKQQIEEFKKKDSKREWMKSVGELYY